MPTQMTHGDAQDLLDTFKRGWESRQPDVIVDLFSEDAEYRPDPFSERLHGHNAIRRYWNEISAASAHVEFDAERIWVSGSTVLASWHGAYTRRATAERVRACGFMTFEINDDGAVGRFRSWSSERVVGRDETLGDQREMEEVADGR